MKIQGTRDKLCCITKINDFPGAFYFQFRFISKKSKHSDSFYLFIWVPQRAWVCQMGTLHVNLIIFTKRVFGSSEGFYECVCIGKLRPQILEGMCDSFSFLGLRMYIIKKPMGTGVGYWGGSKIPTGQRKR